MSGPLNGIKVVDLTMNVMGPLAAQILGDMGADVIKVEPPEGEPMRTVGTKGREPTLSSQFLHLNRNKRSLVLNMKAEASRDVVRRLLRQSDVLVTSQRPQAMRRLGLGYEDAAAVNPKIIYATAFGYGQTGPYAAKPAYDDLIQAALGAPVLQAKAGDPPRFLATNIVDRTCGMALASAVGMALFHRERTGEGQSIEIPMFETMAQFIYGDHLFGETFRPPTGAPRYSRMLERRPFKTRDGWIGMLLFNDRQWQRFFQAIGEPERALLPPFQSMGMRSERIVEVTAYLESVLVTRATADWLTMLDAADIPAMAVKTPEEVMQDPHLKAVGFLREVEHPHAGPMKTFGVPSTWSRSQPDIRREPALQGEHSAEVLAELGLTEAEITTLFASGVSMDGRRTTRG
ncbi:MAG: CaiB/BaiF CoA transferase family protein [Hyphomicrobiaceae bacterium]